MSDDKGNGNEQLEALKGAAQDLVADLKARNLLLPAIVLVAAIVAAFIILPKGGSSSLTSEVPTAPASPQGPTAADRVATVSIVDFGELPSGEPLSDQVNPFKQPGTYSCTTVQAKNPKILNCKVPGNLQVQVICSGEQADQPPCETESGASESGGGSTSETGSTSTTTNGTDGTSTNSDDAGGIYAFRVTVTYDDTQYKNIEQGDQIPPSGKGTKIATFEGVSSTGAQASFRAVEGSTVTGVTVDGSGLTFVMRKGQTAKITDATATQHTLKLVSITKVKIS